MPAPAYCSSRIALAQISPISLALRVVERRGGAFLPDLLMAALQRAVALAEMDRVALAVAENLDLDMARLLEIFFEIDRVVAEGRLGLGARGRRARRRGPPLSRATFMPRPPPPDAAFTSTG